MIVETHGLTKTFRKVHALRGVDLAVEPGSAFALIGPNGAGKTTLLKLLVNLLQPTAGSAVVLGRDSRQLGARDLARIGYVSEGQQLPGRLTIAEYFAYLRPFYPTWDRGLEDELRARMHLPADRPIRKLSHGMRMKTALAAALPFKPELLVLDEPLSGLDPLARDELMDGVLRQAGDTTVVISSHELAEIENAVTHVAYLDSGKLAFQESSSDLQSRVREVRVVLDAPGALPVSLPDGWIDLRTAGNVLTFVETRYAEDSLGERVRAHLPGVRRIETEPLPLRSIFVALARAARHQPAAATLEAP
jgi:ABC-2 type transport system ATP-binding protein